MNEASPHSWKRLVLFFWIVMLGGLAYRINIISLPAYLEFKAGFLSGLFQKFSIPNTAATTTMAAALLTSPRLYCGHNGAGSHRPVCRQGRTAEAVLNLLCCQFAVRRLHGHVSEQWLVAAAAAYAFFALGIQPIENSLIAKFTASHWRSTGYGFAAVLIFGVGAMAVFIVGWVSQHWPLGAVYMFSGGITVLIIVNIIFLILDTRGMEFRNR